MPNYPKNIYLQNNLRLTEKRTVRQFDARLSGSDNLTSPTQRPNYAIPLLDWINERITEGDIIIDCNCEETCNIPIATLDYFKFEDNGLSYQFLDVIQNDVYDPFKPLTINIINTEGLGEDRDVTVVTPANYPYPVIKLTKPSSTEQVGNIDEPEEFTYTITNECGTSNEVEVTIFPVSVDLNVVMND